jgi:hypothetical protein
MLNDGDLILIDTGADHGADIAPTSRARCRSTAGSASVRSEIYEIVLASGGSGDQGVQAGKDDSQKSTRPRARSSPRPAMAMRSSIRSGTTSASKRTTFHSG